MRWTGRKDQSDYMAHIRNLNRSATVNNKAENWMAGKLKDTGLKWSRQSVWGCRVFDFWCAQKGCAVEVDGKEHDSEVDAYRDRYNYLRSGIIVIRVPNFDEQAAAAAVAQIMALDDHKDRKQKMGIVGGKKARRSLLNAEGVPLAHTDWLPPPIHSKA